MFQRVKIRIQKAFEDFANVSTVHGVRDLNGAPSGVFKLMWTLALLGSAAFFIYQTKLLYVAYDAEKTVVSTDSLDIDQNSS